MDDLNTLMEFDRVVQVHADGSVTDAPKTIYAPCVFDGELEPGTDEAWSLLDGYSGQDRYSGPIMHASEYIGAGCRMERDILAQPGYCAAVVASYSLDADDDTDPIDGWAVAYRETV